MTLTLTPSPIVTVTHTEVRTAPAPPNDSIWDVAQGLGAILAVVVALAALVITIKAAARDRGEGDKQRQQDRADADRRLHDERAAADKRLQQQLDEQRDRDRRAFLIAQLQRAGDLYAEQMGKKPPPHGEQILGPPTDPARMTGWKVAVERLRAYLPAIPSPYASLLKVRFFGSHSPLLDEATLREAQRRAPADDGRGVGPIDTEEIYRELADNIAELLGAPTPDTEADVSRGEDMTEPDVARMLRARHPIKPAEDAWERGLDAAHGVGDPQTRVEAHVQLLFGDQAEVVTMYHPHDDPLRVPAAGLAELLGVEVGALAGCRFVAVLDGDGVVEAELIR